MCLKGMEDWMHGWIFFIFLRVGGLNTEIHILGRWE